MLPELVLFATVGLGSEDFEIREAAQARLAFVQRHLDIRPLITHLEKSPDLEVRHRAKILASDYQVIELVFYWGLPRLDCLPEPVRSTDLYRDWVDQAISGWEADPSTCKDEYMQRMTAGFVGTLYERGWSRNQVYNLLLDAWLNEDRFPELYSWEGASSFYHGWRFCPAR